MKQPHLETRYTPSQLASTKRTAQPMPYVSKMPFISLPADGDRPATTIYGATVDDAYEKYKQLPESAVNRSGFMNTTVMPK